MANYGIPITKGGRYDVSGGLVRKRGCTDVLFLLAFLGYLGYFLFLAGQGFSKGNGLKLIQGADFQGNACGTADSTITNFSPLTSKALTGYPYVQYTLNVTSYMSAFAEPNIDFTQSPAAIAAYAATNLQVDNLATTGSATLTTMLNSMSTYFIPVCVTGCSTTVDSTNTFPWDGPLTTTNRANVWAGWQACQTDGSSPSCMSYFTFKALPSTVCPYDPRYCVAVTNIPTQSVLGRYCVPSFGSLTSAYVPSSFSSLASGGFGDYLGDIKTSWKATAITGAASLVVGFLLMYFLRMCVGTVVWAVILASLAIIVIAGFAGLLYSNKCVGQSIFDQTSLTNTSGFMGLVNGTKNCPTGFSLQSSDTRQVVRYASVAVLAIAGLYLLLILCCCRRIRLAIAINQVAAKFVGQNFSVTLIPVVQILMILAWIGFWIPVVLWTITYNPNSVSSTSTPAPGDYTTVAAKCGTAGVYLYSLSPSSTAVTTTFACQATRYVLDYRFAIEVLALLWVNAFILASENMIIGGAVGVWYFTPNMQKGMLGFRPIKEGTHNALHYHSGTLAIGSLLVAIVQFVRLAFEVMNRQAGANNRLTKVLVNVIRCLLACLEKIVKIINKHAYIQTALMGTKFCTSARNAFCLLARNVLRVGVLAGLAGLIHVIGVLFVTAGTLGVGWVTLTEMYDGQLTSPIGPLIIHGIIGFCVGCVVISVFSVAVDSVLQCFLADEELHRDEGGARNTPPQLAQFLR